ncbi:hypothetical protein Q4R10_12285 [Morganella morganii]
MPNAYTQSQINRMLQSGEAKEGPLRRAVTSVKTGKIISNGVVKSATLPPAIITKTDNYIVYNDIDIQLFKNEVREQTSIILQALKNHRLSNAGVEYQQFLDQFTALMEHPTEPHLNLVRSKGIDLYATLENEFMIVCDEINPANNPNQDQEKIFYAVAEANLNLFFHMIIINLAKFSHLDTVQSQLRSKLKSFKNILQKLLNDYVFAESNGAAPWGKEVDEWKTLYGWLLLKENDLTTAMAIYENHENIKRQMSFPDLFSKVMSVLTQQYNNTYTHSEIITSTFTYGGIPKRRVFIAQQIAYYIQQCNQIHNYLDELVSEADNISGTTEELVLDIQNLIMQPATENFIP